MYQGKKLVKELYTQQQHDRALSFFLGLGPHPVKLIHLGIGKSNKQLINLQDDFMHANSINEAMENMGLKLRIPVHVQDYNSFDVFLFCFKSVNT